MFHIRIDMLNFTPPPPPRDRSLTKPRRASTLLALSVLIALAALLSLSASAAAQSTTDYDSDDDGYIDVKTHQQLNAIRYDLNGNGAQDSVSASDWANYTSAFSNPDTGMGCKLTDHDSNSQTADQPTCVGYELMNDIDLDTDGDGNIGTDSGDAYHNNGAGWQPIGAVQGVFRTNFKGNGYTINNLFISRSSTSQVGLFGQIGSSRIETLGVINANVTGNINSGILVGRNGGAIVACYTTGKAQGSGAVGGLVGSVNGGSVNSAYSTAYVTANGSVGGLVGYFWSGSGITNSYSTGRVTSAGSNVGGLIGGALVGATNSYWDTSTSGQTTSAGGSGATGKTTRELQTPTGYTGIYANWNANLDGDTSTGDAMTGNDNPWTFGNKMQYPMLQYKMMSTTPQNSQAMGIADNWPPSWASASPSA